MLNPDFTIGHGPVSSEFTIHGIHTFSEAALFIKSLPYGRNADKVNLLSVFTDQRGTCSTKHGLLKLLAEENDYPDLKLFMGLYRMNKLNSPAVKKVLEKYSLDHIPEAHCYLRYNGQALDFTLPGAGLDFEPDLIEEMEITPAQVGEFKIAFHKIFVKDWVIKESIPYSASEAWDIREQCIASLGA